MKNQNKIIMMVGMVLFSIYKSDCVSGASLDQILSAYCVPQVGGCDQNVKATFTGTADINYASESKNYCRCPKSHMFYDKGSRACKECALDEIARTTTSTFCEKIQCPDGYELKRIENNDCPSGTYLKYVPNHSCETGYRLYSFPN